MSSTVIKVENLGKQYRLGNIGTGTLSHDLNRWLHKIRGKEDPYLKIGDTNNRATKGGSNYVWSLKNINIDIKQGDVLGIIGRNGAGKSTLLKILSRTTSPTTGRVRIKGRVASLLEVGTGFHPELTGRENMYLNGAITGMTKKEITRKFDEIVDFAGVERYIDTPVKRYSSGMYVRLAFGVAAYLEPEILIVDEVLAVGDAEFQKKCLGKMKDVSVNEGRTVLFVSHNMGAVQRLCKSGILLSNGEISYSGTAEDTIRTFMNSLQQHVSDVVIKQLTRGGNGKVKLNDLSFLDANKQPALSIISGSSLMIRFELENTTIGTLANVSVGFSLHDAAGELLTILYSDYNSTIFNLPIGVSCIDATIDKFPFPVGRYYIGVRILENGTESDWPKDMVGFVDVHGEGFYSSSQNYHSGIGSFLLDATWNNVLK